MLDLTEKQMLIQALGQCVYDEVQTALEPIKRQIGDLEKEFEAKFAGMVLQTVEAEREWAREYVSGVVATIPKAENGKDGQDGKDAPPVDLDVIRDAILFAKSEVIATVDEKLAALPKPEKGEKGDPGEPGKDGKDGLNGMDGKSVSLDDIRNCLADLVIKAIGDIPIPKSCVGGLIDRGGHLFLTFSDGSHSDLGLVVGRDGKDCDLESVRLQVATFLASIEKPANGKDGKDGIDGVGFDDLQLEYNGDRTLTFKFVKGENVKLYDLHMDIPLFKDVWRAGEYQAGDEVVRDGSMWIATKKTETVPGAPGSDWRLCTKRGRDGKDGKPGPEGPMGKAGRDGRDLTQLGQDGSKW